MIQKVSHKIYFLILVAFLKHQALKDGDQVPLIGFGTFKVSHRAARTGRNPQTGQEMQIEAVNVPAFSAGKTLKQFVN